MGTGDDQLLEGGAQAPPVAAVFAPDADQYVLRDLATGFAHELNQPLAAIAAYAEGAATLLGRDAGNSRQALSIVQAIAGQALRAGTVVQELRGATRALPGSSMPIDPNALVRTVRPLLEALASQQDVRLAIELRTPAPSIVGDANRLQALLVLLFGSALETVARLPADRRKVTISTDEDARAVELSAAEPRGVLFALHLPRVETGSAVL